MCVYNTEAGDGDGDGDDDVEVTVHITILCMSIIIAGVLYEIYVYTVNVCMYVCMYVLLYVCMYVCMDVIRYRMLLPGEIASSACV